MPEVGMPPTTPPPVSHTSTTEWQSFEVRMRRRRAARCVLRAEVALDAGVDEDARAALDEARRLDSSVPDLETLRRTLLEKRAAETSERRRVRLRSLTRYAAAALVVLTLAAAALLSRDGRSNGTPTSDIVPPVQAAATREPVPAPPSVGTAGQPLPTTEPSTVTVPSVPEQRAATEPRQDERMLPTSGETAITDPRPLPVTAPPPPPVSAPPGQSAVDQASAPMMPVSPPVMNAVSELPGTTASPAVPPPPRVEAREEPAPANDLPKVRAVLAQYEAAYSSLDAVAAQAVWPGVDERSLARAFDSLESQRVSLGRCSISLDGTTANATCNGSATWTPKVGGGTRTEPRRWTFELTSAGGSWQIVHAMVR